MNIRQTKIIISAYLIILLIAASMIYPSFDDWCGLTYCNFDPDWKKYFFLSSGVWRPLDAAIGYINAFGSKITNFNCHFYPVFNHVIIVGGHALNTLLVYKILKETNIGEKARNIATVFFAVSTATMATVLSVDGTNQIFSQFFGLLSLYVYLNTNGIKKYIYWALLIFCAAWGKENGIAWAVVPPVFAYTFKNLSIKKGFKELIFAGIVVIIYGIIRINLPQSWTLHNSYTTFDIIKKLREYALLAGYTCTSTDWILFLHKPSQNLLLGGLSLLFSLPFLYALLKGSTKIWKDKTIYLLILIYLIVMSPNLLIVMSVMNIYAGLAAFAFIIAYIIDNNDNTEFVYKTFLLFLVTAFCSNAHHWYKSYTTANTGKEMALQAIEKTGKADKVYCITIKERERKFSSFCVSPTQAFGWGSAALYEAKHEWPKELQDTVITKDEEAQAMVIAKTMLDKGYDCVWIVDSTNVEVIR